MRAAAAAIRSSGRARRRARAIARTSATTRRHERREPEHDRDALVEHLAGVVRARAGGHHQRLERRRADPQHADADDRQRDPGDGQRRDQDPRGQPVAAAHRVARPPHHGHRGPVAGAAHRRDVARLGRVVAQLLAQAPDVLVDRAVEDVALARAVDRVEQLVAGEDPAAALHEGGQQPQLERAQHRLASRRPSPRGGRGRARGRPWRARCRPARRRAPSAAGSCATRTTSSAGENGLGR